MMNLVWTDPVTVGRRRVNSIGYRTDTSHNRQLSHAEQMLSRSQLISKQPAVNLTIELHSAVVGCFTDYVKIFSVKFSFYVLTLSSDSFYSPFKLN